MEWERVCLCMCVCLCLWTRFLLICLPKALTTISSPSCRCSRIFLSFFFLLYTVRDETNSAISALAQHDPILVELQGQKTEFKIYHIVHDLVESLHAWSTCCKFWACMFVFAYQCVTYWNSSMLCVCHVSKKWGCPASDTDRLSLCRNCLDPHIQLPVTVSNIHTPTYRYTYSTSHVQKHTIHRYYKL